MRAPGPVAQALVPAASRLIGTRQTESLTESPRHVGAVSLFLRGSYGRSPLVAKNLPIAGDQGGARQAIREASGCHPQVNRVGLGPEDGRLLHLDRHPLLILVATCPNRRNRICRRFPWLVRGTQIGRAHV